jgi:predicted NBD/HSP70 family sugar kinase
MPPRVNSTAIRRLNVARVFHALREHPGCSQRDLAGYTGLDKATISAVVAQLAEQGIVERTGAAANRRVGRPETALAIPPSAGLLVGARLEPGTIRIAATTLGGCVVEHLEVAGTRDVAAAIRRLGEGIATVCERAGQRLRAVGIGVPALMDRTGRLVLAPNLGWRDTPIRPLIQEVVAAPVWIDNDTKAAAIAERLFGVCRTVDDFVYVTGDSGLGGGLFLGGKPYRGASGFAGEIGHITVVPDGRPCGCGKRGCLETYVSEAAILADAARAGRSLADVWEVAQAARAGDPALLAILEQVGERLGTALAHVCNLVNPEMVVFGGNLAVVAGFIIPAVERALAEHALEPVRRGMRIQVSPLGADAVQMGGVALAMEGFLAAPDALSPAVPAP